VIPGKIEAKGLGSFIVYNILLFCLDDEDHLSKLFELVSAGFFFLKFNGASIFVRQKSRRNSLCKIP